MFMRTAFLMGMFLAVAPYEEALPQEPAAVRAPAGFEIVDKRPGEGRWAKRIREPRTKIEFVLIKSGEFQMGSNAGESNEKPVRTVTIGRPFYLARTEVTQRQWKAVMGNNPSKFKGPSRPVKQVSWDDCQKFLRELNAKRPRGWQFRLPSEAQWEYACRAGSQGKYSFSGDQRQLGDYAWYGENSGNRTHDVATKRANPWGLFDMHGNVLEWCEDVHQKSYNGAPKDGSAWVQGAGDRVVRGGSWGHTASYCRSAFRLRGPASARASFVGFRPAMVVTTK